MKIVLLSKCSLDIEQYVEFKMSILISPSKSLISLRWVTYKFWQKKGLKLCFYGSPKYTLSYMKRRAAPGDHQKSYNYFCKFRPKRACNYAYSAWKIQNFLRQGDTAPCNPQNCNVYLNYDRKGTEIVHLWFPKYTFSYEKKCCPPCDHQKSYNRFCKFRPKRA